MDLFYETIHTINAADYNSSQLDVWANGMIDEREWNNSFLDHYTIVAVKNSIIVGFGDITNDGYIDRLYTHKYHQRQGIAGEILAALEQFAIDENAPLLNTKSSITAKPFFKKHGYKVIAKNEILRSGIALINYTMEKKITK